MNREENIKLSGKKTEKGERKKFKRKLNTQKCFNVLKIKSITPKCKHKNAIIEYFGQKLEKC